MPNPNGNPNIKQYGFKTDRQYPLTQSVNIRVDEPTKEKLKAGLLPGWSRIAREAIEKALAEVEANSNPSQSLHEELEKKTK